MTTESNLRSALRSRAADAPDLDPEAVLAELARHRRPERATAVRRPGRRWALAGVTAGFVAIAGVSAVVVTGSGGPAPSVVAAAPSTTAATPDDEVPPPGTPVVGSPLPGGGRDAPTAPLPLDSDWVDDDSLDSWPYNPTAMVFGPGTVGSYRRPHQELSIVPAGGDAKDSSDAHWFSAVQVFLPGSGFDPASIGDPGPVTVEGIDRQYGLLPRVLDVPGAAQVPSLLWPVNGAWVVLQLSTPAVPTVDQLAAAAALMDVHAGMPCPAGVPVAADGTC